MPYAWSNRLNAHLMALMKQVHPGALWGINSTGRHHGPPCFIQAEVATVSTSEDGYRHLAPGSDLWYKLLPASWALES